MPLQASKPQVSVDATRVLGQASAPEQLLDKVANVAFDASRLGDRGRELRLADAQRDFALFVALLGFRQLLLQPLRQVVRDFACSLSSEVVASGV